MSVWDVCVVNDSHGSQPVTIKATCQQHTSVHDQFHINVTLFLRVTLIRKPQSTSDLDHFHAQELPCSRVKSRDDPISGRQGDSRVLYSFIYIDTCQPRDHLTRGLTHSVGKFSDSTPICSHWSRPHNKYSLQYLYWNRLSTINLFMADLWQAIIFLPCGFFLLSSIYLFFFPRLISAAADWMSTILRHMVWP